MAWKTEKGGKFRNVHCRTWNGTPLTLPEKDSGQPYYLMDLLERSGVDFEKLEGPVRLAVNGTECGFSQAVKDRDSITIH